MFSEINFYILNDCHVWDQEKRQPITNFIKEIVEESEDEYEDEDMIEK
jgi:hypothetical protein